MYVNSIDESQNNYAAWEKPDKNNTYCLLYLYKAPKNAN